MVKPLSEKELKDILDAVEYFRENPMNDSGGALDTIIQLVVEIKRLRPEMAHITGELAEY